MQRVFREERENVGQQQLLMLLLVMHAEFEKWRDVRVLLRARGEDFAQALVDMRAIGEHFLDGRAREQAALGTRMTRPLALVIGIEEVGKALVEGTKARHAREDERLEEPRRMREVPLRRARVIHGLDRLVLGREQRGEIDRCLTRGEKPRL